MQTAGKAQPLAAGLCLLAAALTGCPRREETRLYLLSALPHSDTPATRPAPLDDAPIRLRVQVAEYLNRTQIVTRVSENQYRLAEYDLWAEPLEDNLSHVLADNLSRLLGTDRMIVADWAGRDDRGYSVDVNVARLDAMPGEAVTLDARWRIADAARRKTYRVNKAVVIEKLAEPGFGAVAAAASRAVAAVSRQIAADLRDAAARGRKPK